MLTFATYVVLARLASPEVFGTLAAGWTIIGVSSLIAESGMRSALIQRQDRLEEAAATATIATLAAGVALALLAFALSPLVGLFFHSHEVGLVAAALAGVLLMNAATVVPDALLRRRFSFLRRAVVDPINAVTYGVVAAALLAIGLGVWALVIASYASGIVRVTTVWLFIRWRPDLRLASFAMWRELARFARHIVASEFFVEVRGIPQHRTSRPVPGIGTAGRVPVRVEDGDAGGDAGDYGGGLCLVPGVRAHRRRVGALPSCFSPFAARVRGPRNTRQLCARSARHPDCRGVSRRALASGRTCSGSPSWSDGDVSADNARQ